MKEEGIVNYSVVTIHLCYKHIFLGLQSCWGQVISNKNAQDCMSISKAIIYVNLCDTQSRFENVTGPETGDSPKHYFFLVISQLLPGNRGNHAIYMYLRHMDNILRLPFHARNQFHTPGNPQ